MSEADRDKVLHSFLKSAHQLLAKGPTATELKELQSSLDDLEQQLGAK